MLHPNEYLYGFMIICVVSMQIQQTNKKDFGNENFCKTYNNNKNCAVCVCEFRNKQTINLKSYKNFPIYSFHPQNED